VAPDALQNRVKQINQGAILQANVNITLSGQGAVIA